MKKKEFIVKFIHFMCYQTYTKYALVLCRLKLLNIELSEICDNVFDQAILTNFNWCIFSNQNMVDVPVFVVAPEIVVWQKRSHHLSTPRS